MSAAAEELPSRIDVAIIGAGVVGANLAYRLRQLGVDRIVVFERDTIGSGSTARAGAGIRRQFGSKLEIDLTLASLPFYEQLFADPDFQGDFQKIGYAFLAGPEHVDDLRAVWRLQEARKLGVQWLEPDDIAQLLPYCALDGLAGGTFCPEDGFTNPTEVVNWLARAARRLGVTILEQTPVDAIVVDDRRVRGVLAAGRHFETDIVLNAAGAWAGRVGELAGAEVPVEPSPRLKLLTDLRPELPHDMPFVTDLVSGAYVRSEHGHANVGVKPPKRRSGFDLSVDQDLLAWMAERVTVRFPSLEHASIFRTLTGLYEVTPDGLPVAGPVNGLPGFYVVAGFNGHGVMHSPGVTQAMAEQIVLGSPRNLDLAPLDPARFSRPDGALNRTIHLL